MEELHRDLAIFAVSHPSHLKPRLRSLSFLLHDGCFSAYLSITITETSNQTQSFIFETTSNRCLKHPVLRIPSEVFLHPFSWFFYWFHSKIKELVLKLRPPVDSRSHCVPRTAGDFLFKELTGLVETSVNQWALRRPPEGHPAFNKSDGWKMSFTKLWYSLYNNISLDCF